MRTAVLSVGLLILASCATPSGPPAPPPAAEPVAPPACDPRLQADVPAVPEPPAGASVVQPVSLEERVATSLHLTWVAELRDVAGQLFARAALAKSSCDTGSLGVRVVGNPPP